jgi:glycosyltransferase involved in cell wall biosynthesis
MKRIVFVGQTPPPYHGQALMIEKILKGNYKNIELIHVRMAFSKEIDEIGRPSFSKIFHLFGVIARIYYLRIFKRANILYYPPAGPDKIPIIRDMIILLSTKWLFKKVIFHFHAGGVSEFKSRSAFFSFLFERTYYNADHAILLSNLNPHDGRNLQAKREWIMPYGIEDNFMEQKDIIKKNNTVPKILFVGVLKESKGVLVLLNACAELKKRRIPFLVELMGKFESKEFEKRVNDLVQQLDIGDGTKFLGVLSGQKKFDAFFNADIFCFPTFYESETFGVVLLEAMQFSLPVVSTNWRGIPTIVDEGKNGFLVQPHQVVEVANKLEILLKDENLRQRMGKEGRMQFLEKFTLDKFHQSMEQVFNMC